MLERRCEENEEGEIECLMHDEAMGESLCGKISSLFPP